MARLNCERWKGRRLGRCLSLLAAWAGLANAQPAFANDCGINDDNDTVEVENDGVTIKVYYLEGSCDYESMCDHDNDPDTAEIPCTLDWPESWAEIMLDEANNSLDGYRDLGFDDPYQTGYPEYKIVVDPTDLSNAHAASSCVTYGTNMTSDGTDECDMDSNVVQYIIQHEMFHHIQSEFACDANDDCSKSGWGNWTIEGTARYMQDKLYSDLDESDYLFAGFNNQVNGYMGAPETSLFDQSYNACVFWNYCGEQLGTTTLEPERGYDFVKTLFEEMAAASVDNQDSVVSALEDTIDSYGGESLDQVWLDFAIANYARGWDLSLIADADKYRYIDEGQFGDTLWAPVETISVGFPTDDSDSVVEYSVKYFEATPAITSCAGVGFRGEADQEVGWAVVGIDHMDRVVGISKGFGTEFGRTFVASPERPIVKLVGIVAGLDEAVSFDYWFDSGTLELEIEDPDLNHPAFIRVDDTYRPLLAQIIVDGPDNLKPDGAGERSVLGLRPEDFTVQVGGVNGEVSAANYVGQYYWLVISAPTSLPEGLYDLSIDLCRDGTAQDTNVLSVAVADVVFNHMLVVDESGSMGDPGTITKLDSVKIAAGLYTDAVSSQDRIGLVSFNGNDVDCDDDATIRESIDDADSGQISAIKSDLEGLTAGGWTAIGDGIWKAQDELDTVFDLADANFMIVLSDGMENEARRWNIFDGCDSAASRVSLEETVIHAIAFGPDADADMMGNIASTTGGKYTYVDVTAAGMRGADQSQANELADAYLDVLQEVRQLERIHFSGGALPNVKVVDIELDEADLKDVIFAFNVGTPKAGLKVDLYDPNGVLVPATMATQRVGDEHAVYHFLGSPAPGTWTAELTSDVETDYISAVLGRNPNSPHLDVELLGIPAGGVEGRAVCDYEQGVPVTILAFLHDDRGPILDAEVFAEIERPDGSFSCSLYQLRDDGAHNDGQPNDGLYGWIYTETNLGGGEGVINDDEENPAFGVRGSYQVRIEASGYSNSFEYFDRNDNASFNVCNVPDFDLDGNPNSWEVHYGTSLTGPDGEADHEPDGLMNKEEFILGTDPFDADTDGDGEPDGSEVTHGRCPTNPDDLVIHTPIDVEVVTDWGDREEYLPTNGNYLRFPWHSEYKAVHIERAKGLPANFELIASVMPTDEDPTPVNYLDSDGLGIGTEYFYRFYAEALDGGISRYSRIVSTKFFPDCNNNDVADPTDISSGNSADCQGNGIPDECDLNDGFSVDADDNGVPDECEAVECEGDTNGDGAVDPLDSGFVLARLGCTVGAGDALCDQADANGDGIVDPLDVGYVLSRFGGCD